VPVPVGGAGASTGAANIARSMRVSDLAKGRQSVGQELQEALAIARHGAPAVLHQDIEQYSQILTPLLQSMNEQMAAFNERFSHLAPQRLEASSDSAGQTPPPPNIAAYGAAAWMTNPTMLQHVQASMAVTPPPMAAAPGAQHPYAPSLYGTLPQQQLPLQLPSSVALCNPALSATPLAGTLAAPSHLATELYAPAPSMPAAAAIQPREALSVPPGAPASHDATPSPQFACAAVSAAPTASMQLLARGPAVASSCECAMCRPELLSTVTTETGNGTAAQALEAAPGACGYQTCGYSSGCAGDAE